jgi:hypothetical protein
MNDKVTVNGMEIQAMADQTFLLISTDNNIDTIQANHSTVVNIEYEEDQEDEYTVYPSTILSATGLTENNIKFSYAIGQDYANGAPTVGDGGEAEYRDIDSGDLADYVVKHTFYITVAKDAIPASNIIVKGLTITSADSDDTTVGLDAIKVAVTTETAGVVLDKNYVADQNAVVLATSVNDTQVLAVNVYIYYDGDYNVDGNYVITTANAAKLEGVNVSITFGVKGA